MTPQETAKVLQDTIYAAGAGAFERAAHLIAQLVEDREDDNLDALFLGAAHHAREAVEALERAEKCRPPAGHTWSIDRIRPHHHLDTPEHVFADAFLTAYCARDHATVRRLIHAALQDGREHVVRCLTQLISDVAYATGNALHCQITGRWM